VTGAIGQVSFRRLDEADLPLIHRWLNNDHVSEWYPVEDVPKPPLDLVRRHYLPMIRGAERTDPYLILLDGVPVGYLQAYMVKDHPEYARAVQVEDGAAGIDLFIGEESLVHRGLGPAVIRRFLSEIVFGEVGATCCIIGPQPNNRSAIRAYEKAGFTYLKTVRAPSSPGEGDEYLMRIEPAVIEDE
jgi:RimJ/RimL family protein N-acetyltransferase